MSSVKQEVAAILMDYTDNMPEDVYMDILKRLGQIPDHKDPKAAIEIQKELDRISEKCEYLEEENECITSELEEADKQLEETYKQLEETDKQLEETAFMAKNLSRFFSYVLGGRPVIRNNNIIMFDISDEDTSQLKMSTEQAIKFIDNLDRYSEHIKKNEHTEHSGLSEEGIQELTIDRAIRNYSQEYNIEPVSDGLNHSSVVASPDELDQMFMDLYSGINIENLEKIDEDTEPNPLSETDIVNHIKTDDSPNIDISVIKEEYNMAYNMETSNDINDAISAYKKIIKMKPDYYRAHFRLGFIYDNILRNFSMAKAYYLSTISIKLLHSIAYNNIGIIYEEEGDYRRAEDSYRLSMEYDQRKGNYSSNTHFNLADLLDKIGRTDEAIAEYDKVLDNNPYDTIAIERLRKLQNKRKIDNTVNFSENTCGGEYRNGEICGFCIDCLIYKLKDLYMGNINNYYGAILLHETNCWSQQQETVKRFKVHPSRKHEIREIKLETYNKKNSYWKNINNYRNDINNRHYCIIYRLL